MRIAKRIICVILSVLFVAVLFTGCSGNVKTTADVILITDGGTVKDGGVNEGLWNGISDYCGKLGISCKFLQPSLAQNDDGSYAELTNKICREYIDLALKQKAQYIVLPSDKFENVLYSEASKNPDVKFIITEGMPQYKGLDIYLNNVMSISFDYLQSGFLAGYMAVKGGNTKLGYFGSVKSDSSSNYGAGFVQGAALAADENGVPVTLDYADYDSELLNFTYGVTVRANYKKASKVSGDKFKVTVKGGYGTGTYSDGTNVTVTADSAKSGKAFDHWDYKSDTPGVKNSKVNLSTTKEPETNLIVEKCDCTITAVYKNAKTYPVTVYEKDGKKVFKSLNLVPGGTVSVSAPSPEYGYRFSKWKAAGAKAADILDDISSSNAVLTMPQGGKEIALTPVYEKTDEKSFSVTVATGDGGNGESEGSGNYFTGETVSVKAAPPKDGYIFTGWTNTDSEGNGANIQFENEYHPATSFTMPDRIQAIPERMYDLGDTIVYGGGNDKSVAITEATKLYSDSKYGIGSENREQNWENYTFTTTKDYSAAVEDCLAEFKGGYTVTGNCANDEIGIHFTGDYNEKTYKTIYNKLANYKIKNLMMVAPGADVRQSFTSKCLTLNYWIYQ